MEGDPYDTWSAYMASRQAIAAGLPGWARTIDGHRVLTTPQEVIWANKRMRRPGGAPFKYGHILKHSQAAFMRSATRDGCGPETIPMPVSPTAQ